MKIAALLWAGLLTIAPAVSACACPEATVAQRMGCEGTAGCCCGDTPRRDASPTSCPRSEAVVDTLDQPAAGLAAVAAPEIVTLVSLELPAALEIPPCRRVEDVGRARASPSRPRFLLFSVLLL